MTACNCPEHFDKCINGSISMPTRVIALEAHLSNCLGVNFNNSGLLWETGIFPKTNVAAGIPRPNSTEFSRLEWVGDRTLSLSLSMLVLRDMPSANTGDLTPVYGRYTSNDYLAKRFRELHLDRFSFKPNTTTNRIEDAKAVEALLGGIFLDKGFDSAFAFVERHFYEKQSRSSNNRSNSNTPESSSGMQSISPPTNNQSPANRNQPPSIKVQPRAIQIQPPATETRTPATKNQAPVSRSPPTQSQKPPISNRVLVTHNQNVAANAFPPMDPILDVEKLAYKNGFEVEWKLAHSQVKNRKNTNPVMIEYDCIKDGRGVPIATGEGITANAAKKDCATRVLKVFNMRTTPHASISSSSTDATNHTSSVPTSSTPRPLLESSCRSGSNCVKPDCTLAHLPTRNEIGSSERRVVISVAAGAASSKAKSKDAAGDAHSSVKDGAKSNSELVSVKKTTAHATLLSAAPVSASPSPLNAKKRAQTTTGLSRVSKQQLDDWTIYDGAKDKKAYSKHTRDFQMEPNTELVFAGSRGPQHKPIFKYYAKRKGVIVAVGISTAKKLAKGVAAKLALQLMRPQERQRKQPLQKQQKQQQQHQQLRSKPSPLTKSVTTKLALHERQQQQQQHQPTPGASTHNNMSAVKTVLRFGLSTCTNTTNDSRAQPQPSPPAKRTRIMQPTTTPQNNAMALDGGRSGNGPIAVRNAYMGARNGYICDGGSGHMSAGNGYTGHGNGYVGHGNGYTGPGNGYVGSGNGYLGPGSGYVGAGNGYIAARNGHTAPGNRPSGGGVGGKFTSLGQNMQAVRRPPPSTTPVTGTQADEMLRHYDIGRMLW